MIIYMEPTINLITDGMSDDEFLLWQQGGEACTTDSDINYLKFPNVQG